MINFIYSEFLLTKTETSAMINMFVTYVVSLSQTLPYSKNVLHKISKSRDVKYRLATIVNNTVLCV